MNAGVILTVNAGSSSVKFSLYENGTGLHETISGQVDGLGTARRTVLELKDMASGGKSVREIEADDHAGALAGILAALGPHLDGRPVAGVGHRIVHGGTAFDRPSVLTPDVMAALARLEPLAPLHQPHNLAGVRAAMDAFPRAIQIGCFDTAFHRAQPWVNDTFALPREWHGKGVRRYGFHGLSYDYVSGELARTEPVLASGRVVIAHLGNGASMCAVRDGRPVGSTMGFSALDGLPMGTRCGQIDPGVLLYMMDAQGMDVRAISDLLYKESGLKGLSGISGDMRTLEQSDDPKAAEAIDYFVVRIRRELGAMAAVLGGLDGLVFCGGIGENSRLIRARVCQDLEWLGIAIDKVANAENRRDIATGRTRVLVIPTDEEVVIARAVAAALAA